MIEVSRRSHSVNEWRAWTDEGVKGNSEQERVEEQRRDAQFPSGCPISTVAQKLHSSVDLANIERVIITSQRLRCRKNHLLMTIEKIMDMEIV